MPSRILGQVERLTTRRSAAAPVTMTSSTGGTGCWDVARSQTSWSSSTSAARQAVGPLLAVPLEARTEQDGSRGLDPSLHQGQPRARSHARPEPVVEKGAVDAGAASLRDDTGTPQPQHVAGHDVAGAADRHALSTGDHARWLLAL